MKIRSANSSDSDQIRRLHRDAFGPDEGEAVAKLACDLLDQPSTPESLHLVAEIDGELAGHVAFSPVRARSTGDFAGFILAPLAVAAGNRKKGVGKALVEAGLRELADQGVEFVLVYGDPVYYERFGFRTDLAEAFSPPFPLKFPFGWQALDLAGDAEAPEPREIECVEALNRPELW